MKLQIIVYKNKIDVEFYIFRSWSGRRYVNGRMYHGPVFLINTNKIDTDCNRTCKCCLCGA